MSLLIQWVIVGVIVAVAAVYLVKRLRPSKNGCCCAGCAYAGSCGAAKDGAGECPTPDGREG